MTDPADDADWSVSVPARHVDSAGTVLVEAQCTDATTGDTVTITLTLTSDRQLVILAHGLAIAGAWSDV